MKSLSLIFPSKKVLFWAGVFLLGIIFLGIYRFLFLLTHLPQIDGVSIFTIIKGFVIGARFDICVLSYIILPFFILSLVPRFRIESKLVSLLLTIIPSIIFGVLFFLSAADLRYFDVFGSRLNYWAIDYFDYPGEFFYSAITDLAFWKLALLWTITMAAFYFCVRRLLRFAEAFNSASPLLLKIPGTVLALALLVLGARGGLAIKPLDWGAALFSENHFVNQMSLNSFYTLAHSVYEENQEGRKFFGETVERFSFYDLDTAYQTVKKMLNIEGGIPDGEMSLRLYPQKSERTGFKPNVIIVIMESWSADRVGALGAKWNVSPHFDSLSREGILFTRFYANGIRTNRGVPATLCSFPSLSGRSIMKRYAADYPFTSFAEILKPLGYQSIFAYGGDVEFDNMEGFLRTVGYDKFYRESDFDISRKLGKWGIPDHIIFEKLAEDIKSYSRPFHLAVLTLSNHDPHLVPDERFKIYGDSLPLGRVLNTFYYSDWAIGQFVSMIRSQPVFDSTIFVFTSDHCAYQSGKHPLAPTNFHIPLLIYAPTLLDSAGMTIDRVGSQVDIVPTLAAIIGTETEIYCWGRDLLHRSPNDSGFAVIVAEEKLGFIEGSKFCFSYADSPNRFLYDLNDPEYYNHNIRDSFPDLTGEMERRLKSYIQLANFLSRGGKGKRLSSEAAKVSSSDYTER